MARFTQIPRITTGTLKKANTIRIYLRVITIADLSNPEGTAIPDGMMTSDWQAGTDLLWPRTTCPPKPYWAIFRKCMKANFCTLAPQYQPSHFSIRLDNTLGPWHTVKRKTKYMVPMLQNKTQPIPPTARGQSNYKIISIRDQGLLPHHRNCEYDPTR